MKIRRHKVKFLLIASLFVIMMLTVSGTAFAQIICTQGSNGHVQLEDRVSAEHRFGWGMTFDHDPGLTNWVHFSVPVPFGTKTQYLALRFATGSVDAWIDRVDVWNSDVRVKIIDGLSWSGAKKWEIIDIGSEIPFTSLNLSVHVNSGVESMSHQFEFNSICAEFHP